MEKQHLSQVSLSERAERLAPRCRLTPGEWGVMSYSHAPGGALCEWMEEVSSGRVMQSDTNRKVPCWKQRGWWEAAAAEWLLCFKTLQATVLQTGSFFTGDQVMKKGLNLKDNKKGGSFVTEVTG